MRAIEPHGSPLPAELLDSIERTKVALKGPVTTPVGGGFTSVNVGLRKALGLFANLRPVWNIPSVPSRYEGIDIVIVRENTEDLYSGLEHEVVPGVVESLKIITDQASTRIATFAFEYARKHGRKRVTAVHKANIMKMGDGLFLKCVRKVAERYPDITCDERIVDAACMHLVMNPAQFDMLLLPNLYGDIVSDLCAGLVGGLGVVPAANLGEEIGVFEAVHGSAPDIAGKGLANPTALLLSALLMLRHIGEAPMADRIMKAVGATLADGKVRTRDLGGTATTTTSTRTRSAAALGIDAQCSTRSPAPCSPGRRSPSTSKASDSGRDARERIEGYLDELRTRQRYSIYRALKHPLYPILRKIERIGEHVEVAKAAARAGRVIYASNHRSHTDYLVEPLVLDDSGIRPPIIAAGINLFGGPLGLIHRHVTGAIPIRRNTKDQAYLLTLKAYVAELLRTHDFFFYPEGGRSYSGELKIPKTGLMHAALQARASAHGRAADGRGLRRGPRGSRAGPATGEALAAAVQPGTGRDGALRGGLPVPRVCHVREADPDCRDRSRLAPGACSI